MWSSHCRHTHKRCTVRIDIQQEVTDFGYWVQSYCGSCNDWCMGKRMRHKDRDQGETQEQLLQGKMVLRLKESAGLKSRA